MNHSKETVLKTVSELFDLVKEKQSKVDALTLQVAEMKSRLNDAYTDGQSAMYTARQSKVDELQKRVDKAIRLLVEAELYQSEPNIDLAVQALKGGSDE